MNKSILKYEVRNIRGIFFLSLFFSIAMAAILNMGFRSQFQLMLMNGITPNQPIVMDIVMSMSVIAMAGYAGLVILQVFMQFRNEKGQDVARFLKALPIKSEEYFTSKLLVGILSISISYLVLIIGSLIVRHFNMFWISDYHNLSLDLSIFKEIDGIYNTIKILLLGYTIILVFYTFLFMIQYKISNIFGATIVGILVWFAPYFIFMSSALMFRELGFGALAKNIVFSENFTRWLNPFIYLMDYKHINLMPSDYSRYMYGIGLIANINAKFIVLSFMILANVVIAHKMAKINMIENEDKLIPMKLDRLIFMLGVTICSGLLSYISVVEIFGLRLMSPLVISITLVGGLIGFIISRKIAYFGCK